jgi:hypothetical protein
MNANLLGSCDDRFLTCATANGWAIIGVVSG